MLGTGIASPPPEVAAGKVSAGLCIVTHQGEYIFIIAVTPLGCGRGREGESVTRIAEFLHHERFLDTGTYSKVLVDILFGVLARHSEVIDEVVFACPTPVVWPQMYIAVVYIGVSTDALVACYIVLAPPTALTSDTDKMVLVERAYQSTCLGEPFLKGRECLLAEGTRLVAYLPRHDGGVFSIGTVCIAVGTANDKAHIVVEELVCLLAGSILRHEVHKGGVAVLVGARCLPHPGMFEIESVAAAPFPRIVEIEHSHHFALAHLHEQVVESGKDGIVVHTRRLLQCRLHLSLYAALAV